MVVVTTWMLFTIYYYRDYHNHPITYRFHLLGLAFERLNISHRQLIFIWQSINTNQYKSFISIQWQVFTCLESSRLKKYSKRINMNTEILILMMALEIKRCMQRWDCSACISGHMTLDPINSEDCAIDHEHLSFLYFIFH